ncbi:MAG: aldo/keto reductase, partial [Dehalococcoidia bacterium]|nr:aldo/keto reductase [Dehalococcoidia bacterium]
MEYVRLGNTGLKVSEYCIGADNFGGQTSAEDSIRIMSAAFDGGVNFIDTANSYCDGLSEENVGRFIKTRRSEVVLASKGRSQVGPNPNDVGVNKKYVTQAVDDSLRRLGTDYIDLYQIHAPDLTTPIEETVEAYNDVVRAGKARYIGVSNFSGAQLVEALWAQDRNGFTRFTSVQPRYNLLYREPERELFPVCRDQGIGVMVYSPQAGGFLLGKHRQFRVESETGGRYSDDFRAANFYKSTYWNEMTFDAMEQFISVTEKYAVSPMALALRWIRSNPVVSACIVGARTIEQLQQNLVAWEEDVPSQAIDEATAIGDQLRDIAPWKPQIHMAPRPQAA